MDVNHLKPWLIPEDRREEFIKLAERENFVGNCYCVDIANEYNVYSYPLCKACGETPLAVGHIKNYLKNARKED